jgi:hypothetical protein
VFKLRRLGLQHNVTHVQFVLIVLRLFAGIAVDAFDFQIHDPADFLLLRRAHCLAAIHLAPGVGKHNLNVPQTPNNDIKHRVVKVIRNSSKRVLPIDSDEQLEFWRGAGFCSVVFDPLTEGAVVVLVDEVEPPVERRPDWANTVPAAAIRIAIESNSRIFILQVRILS